MPDLIIVELYMDYPKDQHSALYLYGLMETDVLVFEFATCRDYIWCSRPLVGKASTWCATT
jgi:hypothetical protein